MNSAAMVTARNAVWCQRNSVIADRLAVATAIQASGLREYYHPFTGAGMGAGDFAWSTLILEMLDASAAKLATPEFIDRSP